MSTKVLSRRQLLSYSRLLPVALIVAHTSSCSDSDSQISCLDPATVDDAQLSLRKSLGYVQQSAKTEKNCVGCAYFNGDSSQPACGLCELFNGPVNASGYCSSWSAKA